MTYKSLSSEDFDAIVTGELTHLAIWMENVIVDLISGLLSKPTLRRDFERLILRRDGLRFQDKIEIVRAMLPLFGNEPATNKLKPLLKEVETFKAKRNAFAHGVDATPSDNPKGGVWIEIVGRSRKEKVVHVTPESHKATMTEAEVLLQQLESLRDELIQATNQGAVSRTNK